MSIAVARDTAHDEEGTGMGEAVRNGRPPRYGVRCEEVAACLPPAMRLALIRERDRRNDAREHKPPLWTVSTLIVEELGRLGWGAEEEGGADGVEVAAE
jgi:hypothetical protein